MLPRKSIKIDDGLCTIVGMVHPLFPPSSYKALIRETVANGEPWIYEAGADLLFGIGKYGAPIPDASPVLAYRQGIRDGFFAPVMLASAIGVSAIAHCSLRREQDIGQHWLHETTAPMPDEGTESYWRCAYEAAFLKNYRRNGPRNLLAGAAHVEPVAHFLANGCPPAIEEEAIEDSALLERDPCAFKKLYWKKILSRSGAHFGGMLTGGLPYAVAASFL